MSAFSNFWRKNLFYKFAQTKIVLAQILCFKIVVCSSTFLRYLNIWGVRRYLSTMHIKRDTYQRL